MNRIGCLSEIVLMTGITIRRRVAVTLAVAILAVQGLVSSGQREVGLVVIEGGIIPVAGAMT